MQGAWCHPTIIAHSRKQNPFRYFFLKHDSRDNLGLKFLQCSNDVLHAMLEQVMRTIVGDRLQTCFVLRHCSSFPLAIHSRF